VWGGTVLSAREIITPALFGSAVVNPVASALSGIP
jgi:hypothetical protein